MALENTCAMIYGAGGAIGGACARAFAREGARVSVAGRTLAPLEALAQEIPAAGESAEAAVERHDGDADSLANEFQRQPGK